MKPQRRLRILALTALLAATIAGCGSTVAINGQNAVATGVAGLDQSGLSTGLATSGQTDASGAPINPSTAETTNPGTPATTETTQSTTGGSTSAGASPSLPPAGTTGRGYDAKTITVGVITSSNSGAFASALGVTGDPGDIGAQYRAAVKYINAHGGVAGRQLVLAVHDIDFATAVNNPSAAATEICTAFTQDRHVFAVLIPLASREQHECLAKAKTPMLDSNATYIAQSELTKYNDLLFGPGTITTERLTKTLITSLLARKFFTGWNATAGTPGPAPLKIGLLYAENPDATNNAQLQVKYLAEAGYKISDTVTYASNVQAGLAATQSAILKFKAEGITHIIGASVFFLQGAEQQNYRPRYVIAPGVGRLYAANSPGVQMRGSMTIGWNPLKDVNAAQSPGDVSPAATLCKQIMKGEGLNTSSEDSLVYMLSICDATFSFRDGLKAAANPSNAALRLGIEALGSTWRSAQTFASTFSATRHASASAFREVGYDTTCSCMKYTSGSQPTA